MRIIIVGGSHAAVAVAAELRQLDGDVAITIISDEASLPYQRPPLSKAYMSGAMDLERLLLRPAVWYEDNAISVLLGDPVISIDRTNRQVVTQAGARHGYDALVLATGARARQLPAEAGGHLANVHVMRTLGDADTLMAKMQAGQRLAVIGGGYIGLEAAAEAAKKGLAVTVIEAAPRILQRVACRETADVFRALHEAHGVTILENVQVERLIQAGDNMASAVALADGQMIDCDLVIAGIGVIPNAELAQAAGLEVAVGISVDTHARTSDPAIYAVGDCTVFPWQQMPTRLESVQNANDQAVVAARNILGDATEYDPRPWFWSDQYDMKLQIAGFNRGHDTIVTRPGKRPGSVSHFYFSGSDFLAVDCMNDGATYLMSRKLLEAGVPLTPEQAADPATNLKALLPTS